MAVIVNNNHFSWYSRICWHPQGQTHCIGCTNQYNTPPTVPSSFFFSSCCLSDDYGLSSKGHTFQSTQSINFNSYLVSRGGSKYSNQVSDTNFWYRISDHNACTCSPKLRLSRMRDRALEAEFSKNVNVFKKKRLRPCLA